MFGGYIKLGEAFDLAFVYNDPDDSAEVDATSGPTVEITENGVDMAYSPTPTDVGDGEYVVSISNATADGFEIGKRYTARVRAGNGTVVSGIGMTGWRVSTNSPDDIHTLLTTVATYVDTEIAAIKAKTDALPADPADASDISTALAAIASDAADGLAVVQLDLARILGLQHENAFDDNFTYDGTDLTSLRRRVFASKAECQAAEAAPGHANGADGEVHRYTLTWTYSSPGVASGFAWVRDL